MSQDTRLQFPRHPRGLASPLHSYKAVSKSRPSTRESLPSPETISGVFVPIKETNYKLSPEHTTDGLTRPKGGQKRAPAIAANEDGIPTLNDGDSNMTTESLDADSSGIPVDIEIIQEELPSDLREEAAATLDPGKKKIEALFGQLGLPLSPDRILRGGSSATGKVEYHTAS